MNWWTKLGRKATEPKQGQMEQQRAELYKALANSSPVGVYVVQNRKFQFANPQFQKYTGYSEDELLGMDSLSLVYPEDREEVRENAAKMLKGNHYSPHEFRIITKGRRVRWIMETVTSIQYRRKQEVLGNWMDITEQREALNRLEELEALEHSILDAVPYPVLVLRNDHIIFANDAVESVFGWKPEELIGKTTEVLCRTEEEYEETSRPIGSVLEGQETCSEELPCRRKDGRDIICLVKSSRMGEGSKKNALIATFEDVTARRKAGEELQEQKDAFNRERELDFGYSVPGLARFRVSALRQRGTVSLVFRLVYIRGPSIDELGLPQLCKELILKQNGLILVTGPAGSGKSTTLAAMINYLNENEMRNVITIEDPIEYLFSDQKCIIRQRELGSDTRSFSTALVHALRHDPDIIVIGEMRDLATISTALTAAETGHLVLGTLHTIDAPQTVDRLIDVFPAVQQRQIRLQLSQVLEAVLSERLLPRIGGGRIAAFEIMLATSVIRRLIREEKLFEIPPNIEICTREGMQTMEQALVNLVRRGMVTEEEALMRTSNPVKLSSSVRLGSEAFRV